LALALGLLALAAGGIALANLGGTSAEGPSSSSFGFQDWLVRCQTAGGKTACTMSQQILAPTSRQAILQLHVGRAPDGNGHQLVVVMPLGVAVASGIAIQIGEAKRNVAFTQCLPGGCVAPTTVDATLLELLKTGASGRVGVVDRVGKTVAVPFSAKGFASAFAKMDERGGAGENDATWWMRFWNSSETK
jgi:invasion protein IalB